MPANRITPFQPGGSACPLSHTNTHHPVLQERALKPLSLLYTHPWEQSKWSALCGGLTAQVASHPVLCTVEFYCTIIQYISLIIVFFSGLSGMIHDMKALVLSVFILQAVGVPSKYSQL